MNRLRTLLIALLSIGVFNQCYSKADKLPNVILINVDDLGWMDLGYNNSKWFTTPNIDQLKSEGLFFENAYAGAANCAPSRACLLSGMNTPRHGVFTVSPSDRGKAKNRKIIPIVNTRHLVDEHVLIPELFKEKGYVTANFGKWHVGEDPATQGVDHNVGGAAHGNPGKDGYFSPYNITHITDGPEGEYLTDRLTDEAIKFISDHKKDKFFAYIPYYAVHTPILPRLDQYELLKENTAFLNDNQRQYAAMVHTVDENVGRLLTSLKKSGLDKNTMIILTSDNGGIRAISPQTPARAGKGSYFEGGLRVPFIVKWPNVIEEGSETSYPTVNLDVFATFSDLLDIKPSQPVDGKSLLPVFKAEKKEEERPIYWHFPVYLQAYSKNNDQSRDRFFRTRPGSAMVLGKWKLHHYFEDDEWLLFDLENDLGEKNNVAEANPEVLKKMSKMMNNWRTEMKAPIPTEKNPLYVAPQSKNK